MITQEYLKSVLHYDPDTGVFTWLGGRSGTHAGKVAGSYSGGGYTQIEVDGIGYKAHRLAFLYMVGGVPTEQVDHINGDRLDNRWGNLRPATRSQNKANSKRYRNNSTGVKGLYWCAPNRNWKVVVRGESATHCSYHKCKLNAVATLYRLQKIIHGEFVNHG